MSFALEFWGVRGSIACPSPQHVAYGGNTACIEVDAGAEVIVLDAGTGAVVTERPATHDASVMRIRVGRFQPGSVSEPREESLDDQLLEIVASS